MRVITSLTCGWRGSCTGRRALVTATGNAAEGIPRGNIRGREGPACGRHPDWMQYYPAHVTCSRRTSSSRDQPQAACLVVRSDDLQGVDFDFRAFSHPASTRTKITTKLAMSHHGKGTDFSVMTSVGLTATDERGFSARSLGRSCEPLIS